MFGWLRSRRRTPDQIAGNFADIFAEPLLDEFSARSAKCFAAEHMAVLMATWLWTVDCGIASADTTWGTETKLLLWYAVCAATAAHIADSALGRASNMDPQHLIERTTLHFRQARRCCAGLDNLRREAEWHIWYREAVLNTQQIIIPTEDESVYIAQELFPETRITPMMLAADCHRLACAIRTNAELWTSVGGHFDLVMP